MSKIIGLVSLVQCDCGALCLSGEGCPRKYDLVDGRPAPHRCSLPTPRDVVDEFLAGIGKGGGPAR